MKAIVMEFDSVFSEEMGCLKNFKVKILINKMVGPRFCWAKPIPCTMKVDLEKELDHLEFQGNFKLFMVGYPQ